MTAKFNACLVWPTIFEKFQPYEEYDGSHRLSQNDCFEKTLMFWKNLPKNLSVLKKPPKNLGFLKKPRFFEKTSVFWKNLQKT